MKSKDFITKLGAVRNQANLSARELSQRLGKSPQYIAKLESGEFRLNVDTLIDILSICNCPIEKFFYESFAEYETDKELLSLIKSLSKDKKEHLISFLKSKN